jgi:acetylornithine deacetylase
MARSTTVGQAKETLLNAGERVASELDEEDRAVLAAVDAYLEARRDELLEFAVALVSTPSINPPGDESAVAKLVADRLRALGARDVQIKTAAPGRDNVLAMFGDPAGSRALMYSGHLDTKPPGELDDWDTPPFEPVVRDGRLVGLGAVDMKGAVAAIVYGAAAAATAELGGSVKLAFTADEEAGGVYGSKWLAENGLLEADACVIAEPSGVRKDWEAIRLVSRGVAIFKVSVRGTEMHSSLTDDLDGVSANLKAVGLMSRMSEATQTMLRFEAHPLSDRGPTFNVGLYMKGGVGYGVCPGHAEFLCDVRALPGMSSEEIESDVRAFIAAAEQDDPTLETDFEMLNWTPPSEIDAEHALVAALSAAAEDVLGEAPPLGIFPGGTDAPYFSGIAGIPTVPSFGPGLLTSAHSPNESILVESIVQAARIYARASVRFLNA